MDIEVVQSDKFVDAKRILAEIFRVAAQSFVTHPEFSTVAGHIRVVLAGASECAQWRVPESALGFQAVGYSLMEENPSGEIVDAYEINDRNEVYINLDVCLEELSRTWQEADGTHRAADLESVLATLPHELLHVVHWLKASGDRTPLEVFDAGQGELSITALQAQIDAEQGEDAVEALGIDITSSISTERLQAWADALDVTLTHGDTIYARLRVAGCEIDYHESDLYVRNTEQARHVIKQFEDEGGRVAREPFQGTDGLAWIDIPFMYVPRWRREPAAASPRI